MSRHRRPPTQRSRSVRHEAGTAEQRRAQGQLVYGFHVASAALMTCLVFNRHGGHVHFVDGAQGGYAMAAQMKAPQKSAFHWNFG